MAGDLPPALRQAIERRLEGVSRTDLGKASARMSEHYRAGGGSQAIAGRGDVLSYLVARLPATYAATAAALEEVRRRAPGFAPEILLDVGAGPGSASWAAVETWPGIGSVAMLDRHAAFLDMAASLAADSGHAALRESRRVRAEMTDVTRQASPADLVVASYALAEIPAGSAADVVADLWRMSRGVLVLVEPGTPAGFERIRQARDALLASGATVVAPCPHGNACPVIAPDWCHFAVRLSRSRDHRLAKAASVNFEDEKFSYVAAARPGIALDLPQARVLSPPRINKAEIRLKLCTPSGLVEEVVPRRDREGYARARRLGWGSAVVAP